MSQPPPLSPAPRRWRPPDNSLVDRLNELAAERGDAEEVEEVDDLLTPTRQNSVCSVVSNQSKGSATSSSTRLSKSSTVSSTRSSRTLKPQVTGESLARQYDDLYASLDALANPFDELRLDTPKITNSEAMPGTPTASATQPGANVATDRNLPAGSLSPSKSYPATPVGLSGYGLGIKLASAAPGTPQETPHGAGAASAEASHPAEAQREAEAAVLGETAVSSLVPSAPALEATEVLASPFSHLSKGDSLATALSFSTPASEPARSSTPSTHPPSKLADAPPPVPSKSLFESQRKVTPTKRSGAAIKTPASKRSVVSPGTLSKARVSNLMKMFEPGSAMPAKTTPMKAASVGTVGRSFGTATDNTPTRVPSATPSGVRNVGRIEPSPTVLDGPRDDWQVRSKLPAPAQLDLGPVRYVPPPTPVRKLSKSPPYQRGARRSPSLSRSIRSPSASRSPPEVLAASPGRLSTGTPGANRVRSMIAAWRARSTSGGPPPPSLGSVAESMALEPQATGTSAGGQSSASVLTGVTGGLRSWNMSIRRRRREESSRAVVEEEPEGTRTPSPPTPVISSGGSKESVNSSNRTAASGPSQGSPGARNDTDSLDSCFAGEVGAPTMRQTDRQPLRTGVLYYFQVHVGEMYEWIRTDARLHPSGLVLTHRTPDGSEVRIVLDLDNCEGK